MIFGLYLRADFYIGGVFISSKGKSGKAKGVRVNEAIRGDRFRVIADDGTQLGILSAEEALAAAEARGLDLVEVAPDADPPVCRIMDYGKYLYTEQKRMQAAKKKQKKIVVKEMKFRPKIDEHDYNFKKNHIIRFLKNGDRVKVTIRFRGRELAHKDKGFEILARLKEDLGEYGYPEGKPTFDGINMVQVFMPHNSKSK